MIGAASSGARRLTPSTWRPTPCGTRARAARGLPPETRPAGPRLSGAGCRSGSRRTGNPGRAGRCSGSPGPGVCGTRPRALSGVPAGRPGRDPREPSGTSVGSRRGTRASHRPPAPPMPRELPRTPPDRRPTTVCASWMPEPRTTPGRQALVVRRFVGSPASGWRRAGVLAQNGKLERAFGG